MTVPRVRTALLQPHNIKPLIANLGEYADAGANAFSVLMVLAGSQTAQEQESMLGDVLAGPVYKLLVYEALNNPSCLRALATGNGDIGDLQQQTMVMISLNYMLNLARPSQ